MGSCEHRWKDFPDRKCDQLLPVSGQALSINISNIFGHDVERRIEATRERARLGDAIHAEFADYYIPEADWPDLIAKLENTGDWTLIDAAAQTPPDAPLKEQQAVIDHNFGGETLRDIVNALRADGSDWAQDTLKTMDRNAPRAMAAAVELVHRARMRDTIEHALTQEYRFNHRIAEQGDFQEGIRALIVDKDKSPFWAKDAIDSATHEVATFLMPLGADELKLEDAA